MFHLSRGNCLQQVPYHVAIKVLTEDIMEVTSMLCCYGNQTLEQQWSVACSEAVRCRCHMACHMAICHLDLSHS